MLKNTENAEFYDQSGQVDTKAIYQMVTTQIKNGSPITAGGTARNIAEKYLKYRRFHIQIGPIDTEVNNQDVHDHYQNQQSKAAGNINDKQTI